MKFLNRLALPLCAVLIAFMAYVSVAQLSTDASPAAAFCTAAQRQGIPCETGPKYDAQIVQVTDATGSKLAYLIVSANGKQIGVVPLQ